jgi:hypothetical protein
LTRSFHVLKSLNSYLLEHCHGGFSLCPPEDSGQLSMRVIVCVSNTSIEYVNIVCTMLVCIVLVCIVLV